MTYLFPIQFLTIQRNNILRNNPFQRRLYSIPNIFSDVPSIPFHAGEIVSSEPSQNQGLSVLESLAIGVCVLLLIFVYAAGIIFYIHYKKRQKRKDKDPENNTLSTDNGSTHGSRIDLDNVVRDTLFFTN